VNRPDALLAIQDQQRRDAGAATLDVLHRPEDGPAGSGLDRLPDLVERARSAGLPVTLTVSGQPRELPTGIDRAAYRVVQEALTNITRHAGEASASLHLGYGPHELTVEVDDDGGATSDTIAVPGVGLIGMRERITALGGKLEAGPRPAGGFSVRATLPVTAAS
jgi:signal transduction histidine kinase